MTEYKDIQKQSDEELVNRLPLMTTGSVQGEHEAKRDHVIAELNRRSAVTMIKLTKAIYILTGILVLFGAIQIWLTLRYLKQ